MEYRGYTIKLANVSGYEVINPEGKTLGEYSAMDIAKYVVDTAMEGRGFDTLAAGCTLYYFMVGEENGTCYHTIMEDKDQLEMYQALIDQKSIEVFSIK